MTDERIVAVTMPKWGLSMQLGKIISWIATEGDAVSAGDELADIETDKIAGTLEAASAGTLRRIIARVGEDVPVSGTIALIAPADVSDDDLDAVVQEARAVIDAGVRDEAAGGPAVETADIGGRKICYAGVGEGGDVVLLVHGYGGDRDSWLFLQEPLAARHRVYALDLPGHGTSSKDVGDGSAGILADTILGVLDAIGAEHAHLVGHSLGGAAAVAATARDPRRISSLTLIAPSGFGQEINAGYLRGFARGALLGARGNSGVILSQMLRGIADAVDDARAEGELHARDHGRDGRRALYRDDRPSRPHGRHDRGEGGGRRGAAARPRDGHDLGPGSLTRSVHSAS